jgi:outer membrane protein assembly factor BamB
MDRIGVAAQYSARPGGAAGQEYHGRVGRLLIPLLAFLASLQVAAEDWPQFRGPTGQGHSSERGLPVEWSETKNVAWKVPVRGLGWSSPVVANGRVWLTAAVPERTGRGRTPQSLRVYAFDATDGRQLVDSEIVRLANPRYQHPKTNFASPTPIVDGDRVYVHFGADGTAAVDLSGKVLWKTTLPFESQHGASGSPALYRDLLIVSCDGNPDEAYVVALDTRTGKERWRAQRRQPRDQAYTTPLVIRVGEQDQIVSAGAYRAAAYDPATGRELWRVAYEDGFSNVPRPVFGQGLVFIATGFNEPTMIAVRPDGSGDVTRTHVAWTLRRGAPFTPSPILVGQELYVVSDTGILTVVDAQTGKVHGQQRLGGNYSASPVFADGRLYFQSEEGTTTVAAPGPVVRPLAVNQLDGLMLASLAVSNGALFVRTDTHLYRIGNRP